MKWLSKTCSQRKHYLEINNLQTFFCVLYINLATFQIVCLKPKKLFEKTGTNQWLETLLRLIFWWSLCVNLKKNSCVLQCAQGGEIFLSLGFSWSWFGKIQKMKKWYKLKSAWAKKKNKQTNMAEQLLEITHQPLLWPDHHVRNCELIAHSNNCYKLAQIKWMHGRHL